MNKEGDMCFGQSPIAGRKAVFETAMSRFVLPAPVLFGPAFLNLVLTKMRLMPKSPALKNILEMSLVTVSLIFGLPFSVALYKQQSMIEAVDLEP